MRLVDGMYSRYRSQILVGAALLLAVALVAAGLLFKLTRPGKPFEEIKIILSGGGSRRLSD